MQWWVLPLVLVLDLAFGDPVFALHPVRLVGRWATLCERTIRRLGSTRWCGVMAWVAVMIPPLLVVTGLLAAVRHLQPMYGSLLATLTIYWTLCPRDLARHAGLVEKNLRTGNIHGARAAVGCIVGRDTAELDAGEIARAAVEAVAESTVDGVTAPLFYTCLFGPLGAVGYRVINTLDSMWGHRDQCYERFGWAAARADDLAGFIPARLTLIWIALGAALCRMRPRNALRVALHDGGKHPSPNSGLSEAAFSGALGVVLGGRNRYDGQWVQGPVFGEGQSLPNHDTIRKAIVLMGWSTLLAVATLVIGSLCVTRCWP